MSHSSYSSREPKRLLERAAALIPEGAVMPREQAQALIEKRVVRCQGGQRSPSDVDSGYRADVQFAWHGYRLLAEWSTGLSPSIAFSARSTRPP